MARVHPALRNRNLLRIEDVSEILGYHPQHVHKLARAYEAGKELGIYSRKDYKGRRVFTTDAVEDFVELLRTYKRPYTRKKAA